MKLGKLFAEDKKKGIYICASSTPQILPETPTTNRKSLLHWYSGLSHISGYKCFEFGGKYLLTYPVPSNDNKKDYELSMTDFNQLPPDPFATLARGKNTDKNYHQILVASS